MKLLNCMCGAEAWGRKWYASSYGDVYAFVTADIPILVPIEIEGVME